MLSLDGCGIAEECLTLPRGPNCPHRDREPPYKNKQGQEKGLLREIIRGKGWVLGFYA